MIQNPDQWDFSGNTENTPSISISSGVDLKIDQDRNHETRNIENFEDDNISPLTLRYDRQLPTHHNFIRNIYKTKLSKPKYHRSYCRVFEKSFNVLKMKNRTKFLM